jgi:hypothetical protein
MEHLLPASNIVNRQWVMITRKLLILKIQTSVWLVN